MSKKIRRVSLVFLIDSDDAIAEKIGGAVEVFARDSFPNYLVSVEKSFRVIMMNNYVDEKISGGGFNGG